MTPQGRERSGAMAEKADVVLIGVPKKHIVDGLSGPFNLHVIPKDNAEAIIAKVAPNVRARRRDRRARQDDGRPDGAFPEARIRVELWRRLRQHRRQICCRARHHRHQHAGGAERRGRRHRARAAAVHRARVSAGRELPARRKMDGAAISAEQRDLARPHRRHGRHGPHRPGDRAAARRLRRAGGLSQPQSAGRRRLSPLSEDDRHGARRRHAHSHHAGRAIHPASRQRRSARRARARAASSSTCRAARWSTTPR